MTQKSIFSIPYIYPLIVSILSTVAYYSTIIFNVELSGLRTILGGISAATFGSYVTVVLVERSFREQERDRRNRMESAALRQFRFAMNRHLRLLSNMYLVSLPEHPKSPPSTFEELFQDDFSDTVMLLDFSQEYPTAGENVQLDWLQWTGNRLGSFQEEIDQIISQYGAWLDPEVVETLQKLKESTFMNMLTEALDTNLLEVWEQNAGHQGFPLLSGDTEFVEEHTALVQKVIHEYETHDDVDINTIEETGVWREDVSPHAGSARLEIASNDASRGNDTSQN